MESWRDWHPIDTLTLLKYKSFFLSWNWMHDLARENLKQMHPDLADLADELNAFRGKDFLDNVTIIDDDDLRAHGQYSEVTLT